ncbi:hypothetical protein HMI54_012034 [Coelomomyces lativittatus]|nr:hypothetical protein HMI54_012034 [Coelomomyces lativittatus]
MFLSFASLAQAPCFTADRTTVCVGTPVTFTQCPGWTLVRYNFDDGNGLSPIGVNTVTYTEPGVKSVLHNGNKPVSNKDSTIGTVYITVVLPTPPVFEIKSCASRNVSLTLTDNVYDSYILSWESNSSQAISKGATINLAYPSTGSKTIKITGTSATGCVDDTTYLFEVFDNLVSPVITNITSEQNQLSWKM